MAANPSSYDPEACVFNTEETYWVQRQSEWLYSLLSQDADQRWWKVWQVKMNSQCQNDEIKLLIFLFCLSVVSLLSIAVQWNSVVSTWRFSFILMQRSRDDGVSCLRFAGRWYFLCYDLHVLKVDPYHVEQPLKQFWSCLNDWSRAVAAEECDIRFMKTGLTGGILQSIVCSGPLLFWPSIRKTCSASEKLYCETFFALHVRVTSLYIFMLHDIVYFLFVFYYIIYFYLFGKLFQDH